MCCPIKKDCLLPVSVPTSSPFHIVNEDTIVNQFVFSTLCGILGNLEFQTKTGGAGGTIGLQAKAVLYYHNPDIGRNKVHIEQSIKDFCQSTDKCLKMQILTNFGIKPVKQNRCCCICFTDNITAGKAVPDMRQKVRKLPASNRALLEEKIKAVPINTSTQECFLLGLFDLKSVDIDNLVQRVMGELEYTSCEADLLTNCGIWDGDSSSQSFCIICSYTSPK